MVYTVLEVSPVDRNVVLAGTFIIGHILRLTNGGTYWTEVMPSMGVDTFTGRRNIYDLAFSPDANSVYAATGYNIFDGGFEEGVIGSGLIAGQPGWNSMRDWTSEPRKSWWPQTTDCIYMLPPMGKVYIGWT